MSYTKHNFADGQVLHAAPLNEMDNAIANNETEVAAVKADLTELDGSVVKTVNGVEPTNGNVNVPTGGTVKSVNNIFPDSNGNIVIPTGTPEEYTQLVEDVAKLGYTHAKNYFDVSRFVDGYLIYNGNKSPNANWGYFDYKVMLKPNQTYRTTKQSFYDLYNANNVRIKSGYTDVHVGSSFVTPNDVAYGYFSVSISNKTVAMLYEDGEASDFEPYRTVIGGAFINSSNVIKKNGDDRIRVSKAGNGDFTSLLRALYETDADILVVDGEYNVFDEYIEKFGANYWTNYSATSSDSFDNGLFIHNRSIEFANGTKVICDLTNANQTAKERFSAFACGYNYTIKNLYCISNYGKYVIHDDYDNNTRQSINVIDGCFLVATNLVNGTNPCIGGGLGMNTQTRVNNCYCDSGSEGDSIQYHTKNARVDDGSNGLVEIIGCYTSGKIRLNCMGLSTVKSIFKVHNCSAKTSISKGVYDIDNGILLSYANEIRS